MGLLFMKKQVRENILIFSRIGKSPLSSLASENLLLELLKKLAIKYKYTNIKIYFYPIFNFIYDKKSFFFSFLKNYDKEKKLFLFSTSIKFIRDFFYIFQTLIIQLIKNRGISFYYNLNQTQLFLIEIFNLLNLNTNLNLIQADGFNLKKSQIKLFKNIITFSKSTEDIYISYKTDTNITFALPLVCEFNLNYSPKFVYNRKRKIQIVHCGSISEYNLSLNYLKELIEICRNNENIYISFTTSQQYIPSYFLNLKESFPKNIRFLGCLDQKALFNLLRTSDFALDLRSHKNMNSFSTDFPSKIFLYMQHNLFIFSSISNSIPNEIKSILIPFDELYNLNHLDFSLYLGKIPKTIDYVEQNLLCRKINQIISN